MPLRVSSGVIRLRLPHSLPLVTHPVSRLFKWLPECDFAVLDHGFAPHGRDYRIIVEHSGHNAPGRHQLLFTHVVDLAISTTVRDDVWKESWSDVFTDYAAWEQADEPEGYIWGVNWSLAYPGLKASEASETAAAWSKRLGRPMYEAVLVTNQFRLTLLFHDIRTERVDDRTDLISRVIIPLR